jgi:2'-5' RNA ligase
MHLTLKFLGAIDKLTADKVAGALERATARISPFRISTKEVTLNGRRILWLTFKENKELKALKEAVEIELEAIGIKRDKKPYTPHLTLRRIKKKEIFFEVKESLLTIESSIDISFPVENIEFMESELIPDGAIHSTLRRIILHKANTRKDAVDDI